MPGHEGFLCIVAKSLLPAAGFPEVGSQRFRDRLQERGLGGGREVPGRPQYAHLVFHLHENDGVIRVMLPQVSHELCKGPFVRLHRLTAEGRQDKGDAAVEGGDFPLPGADVPEPLPVLLDPLGHIGGGAVLPQAEPQQLQPHILPPRLLQKAVHQRKVELALLRLDALPVHRHNEAVHVAVSHSGPDGFVHIFKAAGGGIVHLPGTQSHGRAVHDQCGVLPHTADVWKRGHDIPLVSFGFLHYTIITVFHKWFSPYVDSPQAVYPDLGFPDLDNRIQTKNII